MMSDRSKIASLELGRLVAMIAIIMLHCQMFLSYFTLDGEPWFGYVFNQLTRFAVPLFFLIAGYLIQPKLTNKPWQTVLNYGSPLIRIWAIWSVISLLMPFNWGVLLEHGYLAERQGYWSYLLQTPLNSLLEGGLVHLWFIPALLSAIVIIAALIDFKLSRWILPLSLALYCYGVLAGSYAVLTELPSPFFTRNGPFFATLMVAIGFTLRQSEFQFSASKAIWLTGLGLSIHIVEAYWLHGMGQIFNTNDFLFGTIFWATGIMMYLLTHPDLGRNAIVFSLSKRVLPVYVCHLPMVIVMMNVAGFFGLTHAPKDAIVLIGTLVFSYLLVVATEKTPLNRWLFR